MCLSPLAAFAGDALTIRLVEATTVEDGKVESGLEDVARAMKMTSFNNYRLVASSTQRVPAKSKTTVLGQYSVKCSGKQKSMKINVYRAGKIVARTPKGTYLQDNRPFILAGLPGSKTGSLMLVFVVK
jgi:hypothetical protein